VANPDSPFPLRAGTATAAATIRAVLVRAAFSESAICERLRIPSLDAVDLPLFKSFEERLAGAGLLEQLARAFVFGGFVGRTAIRDHVSREQLQTFIDADLLRPWAAESDQLFSPVRLVPIALPGGERTELLIAGDRGDQPDGSRIAPFSDIVFPGHNPLTREFLKLLPRSGRETVLDVCAGTGVAALAMAAMGARATAADIAERSVHFARFNGWLNGCERLEVACGDLYGAVAGRGFDCIAAHPPYVPAMSQQLTYRDGGETGDEIVRRVVEGIPDHLNTGGTFHLLCLGMDTGAAAFEERIRSWLGPAGREFDVVFALDSTTPPELIATRLIDRGGGSAADLNRWRALFEQLQVKVFVYGAIAGRRFGGNGEAFTRRVLMTETTTAEGFEALFHWFDWLRQAGQSAVLDLKPVLPPDLRLDVQHRIENGTFVPATYFLENGGRPFKARLSTQPWVAAMLSELDGVNTLRDVFRTAVSRGRVPPDFGEADLERLMRYLIERGCVSVSRKRPVALSGGTGAE
jgi:SAM-dependent methyltransferase